MARSVHAEGRHALSFAHLCTKRAEVGQSSEVTTALVEVVHITLVVRLPWQDVSQGGWRSSGLQKRAREQSRGSGGDLWGTQNHGMCHVQYKGTACTVCTSLKTLQ